MTNTFSQPELIRILALFYQIRQVRRTADRKRRGCAKARVNTGVKANTLITRFITACHLALDLDPADLDNERDHARNDPLGAYSQFDGWSGSSEATVELLAYARTASVTIWRTDDDHAQSIIHPIWREIAKQQPGVCLEYFMFNYIP